MLNSEFLVTVVGWRALAARGLGGGVLVYFCISFLLDWIGGRGVAGDGVGRQEAGGEVAGGDDVGLNSEFVIYRTMQ